MTLRIDGFNAGRLLVAVVAILLGGSAAAQSNSLPDAPHRPKICLVLSGGGARGAAHIGVLKVLQEMHVPVDCIAATSMGSLVGGAYATGMSTDEMETLVAGISTSLLFEEKPPRQDQAIRRKLDDRSILFGIEFGLRDGQIHFPKAIVSGIQLETVLRNLAKVPGFRNFDELPIPFRAVATDLVTGKPVIFHDGELASVMRASMSIPGAVVPAQLDGKILVDGGLTDNLPVDAARAMGADVVIAVNLGTPLLKRDELGSILGVTGQMINILTEQNVQRSLASLKPTDILIEPALGDFSAANFDDLPKAIPVGEAAARGMATRLASLAIPETQYAALRQRQQVATAPDTRPVDIIRFAPMAHVNADVELARMDTKPNEPIDQEVLDRDIRRAFGSGDFEHVGYRILEDEGKRVLNVDAVEKTWGPNYLRFGLALGSDLQGDNFFNLAASYRRTWINSLNAEWRVDAQMGRTSRLATEFYQPLDIRQFFFVAPRGEVERSTVDLFSGNQRVARYNLRTSDVGLDVGSEFTKYGEARLGLLTGRVDVDLDTGSPDLAPNPSRANQGAVTARLILDQLDSVNFPRSGFAGSLHLFASRPGLGATVDYTKWDADFINEYSIGPHSLQFALKAGGNLGSNPLPSYDEFQWGGFLQQSGYATGALYGQRLTFGRLVYSYKILNQQLLEGLYGGVSLELGRMEQPLVTTNNSGLLKSTALYLGADTPVGPLYLGFGWAAGGNRSAYLYLGRP
jgi:NTE family protein